MLRVKSNKSDWLIMRKEFSAHAQKIGPAKRSRFLVLIMTKRSVVSRDENAPLSPISFVTWCYQEHITSSMQAPHISVTAFSQIDLFFSVNLLRIQDPAGDSVTNDKHGHEFKLASSSHRKIRKAIGHFFLTDAHSCRPELTYFAGKEALK